MTVQGDEAGAGTHLPAPAFLCPMWGHMEYRCARYDLTMTVAHTVNVLIGILGFKET